MFLDLSNPLASIQEQLEPRAKLTPFGQLALWLPRTNISHDGSLRVRHHSNDAAVPALHTSDTLRATVRVEGVSLSNGTVVVDVAERNKTGVIDRRQVTARGEFSSALTVGDDNGERRAVQAVEEDRVLGLVFNGDHRVSALELCASVLNECWPVVGSRDKFLESGQHLTTVAYTE